MIYDFQAEVAGKFCDFRAILIVRSPEKNAAQFYSATIQDEPPDGGEIEVIDILVKSKSALTPYRSIRGQAMDALKEFLFDCHMEEIFSRKEEIARAIKEFQEEL